MSSNVTKVKIKPIQLKQLKLLNYCKPTIFTTVIYLLMDGLLKIKQLI